MYLGQLFKEAGFPPGVVNFVSGGGKVGALLASHMEIAKISFTGSAGSGRQVQIAAAKSNLKHVSLELGGKSPSIIFDDANLENAVAHNSQGVLVNSGQVCVAGTRILVQTGIAPKFIEAVKGAFQQFSGAMADPSLENTFLGPLADQKQFDRVMQFLTDAKKEGIEMITGGTRKGDKGTFVEPTIIMNPGLNSKVYTDEIFGPVLDIVRVRDFATALDLVNSHEYGNGAAIFTRDGDTARSFTHNVLAGMVGVNVPIPVPMAFHSFGGWKRSLFGDHAMHGPEGVRFYTRIKTVTARWPEGIRAGVDTTMPTLG